MKHFFFLLLFVFSLSFSLHAQQDFPFATNNAFTIYDSGSVSYLKKFNMSQPYNLTSIGSGSSQFKQSLEFGAPGYLYFITMPQSFNFRLYRIDTASGTTTQISTTSLYLSGNINYGLSWDRTNNTMYTIFNNPSTIYTVNLTTGTFTMVNALSPTDHVTAFAVNNAGSMFGLSTLGNKFERINKTTGATTLIGTIGLTVANISGCDFDPLTGNMYILVQNGTNTDVYRVDTATANTTLTGTISKSVSWLAIAGNTFIGIKPISTEVPAEFSLQQNYPNPFNPSTIIRFLIKDSRSVSLKIFDVIGKEVTTLVNEQLKAGEYEINWDASAYASGIYYYKLVTDNFSDTKKMVLIK